MTIQGLIGHYASRLFRGIFFVKNRQLRNSHHRSVSGFAENGTVVGISSLSDPIRFAGFGSEGDGGCGLGRCGGLMEIAQEKPAKGFPAHTLFLAKSESDCVETGRLLHVGTESALLRRFFLSAAGQMLFYMDL